MDDGMLELETRRGLYELIQSNPGLHMRELSRQCDLLPSLVEYHLRHLLKYDLVYSIREQGYTRFYITKKSDNGSAAPKMSSKQRKILHLIRQDSALTIILIILERTKAKHKDILKEMSVSGSTLSYYLNKLVDAEVLLQIRTGNDKGYWIKDKDEIIKILIIGRIKPPTLTEGFISTWDDFM